MDDVVRCSYEECQGIYRELKELIMNDFATGANDKAQLSSMVNADMGNTHMTVMLSNAPDLPLTDFVNALSAWREGTTIHDETQPGGRSKVFHISVPILKRRPRHHDRDRDDGRRFPPARYGQREGEMEKPSSTTLMLYVTGLVVCGTMIVYKAATGQAPQFLTELLV